MFFQLSLGLLRQQYCLPCYHRMPVVGVNHAGSCKKLSFYTGSGMYKVHA